MPVASAVATADLSPQEEEEWKDRFGKHNVAVGILLFVWGTVVSSGPPQNGGEKVLRSHEQLGNLIDGVQLAALLSGVVLAASGVALRRGWGWGHPAAVLCAIVMVVAGFIFLAGFQSLAGGPTLEDGVARITFIRENLDMLIGLVDGLGLHWFISTRLPRPGARSYS